MNFCLKSFQLAISPWTLVYHVDAPSFRNVDANGTRRGSASASEVTVKYRSISINHWSALLLAVPWNEEGCIGLRSMRPIDGLLEGGSDDGGDDDEDDDDDDEDSGNADACRC